MRRLTIATRGSRLALWQARHVADRIRAAHPALETIDILTVKTKGDKILDVPLAKVGGKGLFVKEIEEALLDGRADIAVHSMKDVPATLPPGLALKVIMKREVACDMLLSMHFPGLDALPPKARVGTSSLRRQAQLLAARPDLCIVPLRGNVDTRLAKLAAGEFDAIVMAAAGISRLGLSAPHMVFLPDTLLLPAAGQGALGLECCEDRQDIADLLAPLDDRQTHVCVMAERGFLAGMDGGCQAPLAAYAMLDDTGLMLQVLLSDPYGRRAYRNTMRLDGSPEPKAAYRLGLELAGIVRRSGGDELLQELFAGTDANA